jgi:hypothetical protein
LSERLRDPWLGVEACVVKCFSDFAAGRFRDAERAAQRAMDLERKISDPDTGERLRESTAALFMMRGQLPGARRLVDEHHELSRKLFPHHRLHSAALDVELLERLGEWQEIRALVPRTRSAMEENLATPCVRGPRSLLVCAAACAALGDDTEAAALERIADELPVEDFGWIIDAPRIRLALYRSDLGTVTRLVSASPASITRRQIWYFPSAVATHFDALAALGDLERVESDAPEFLETDSVLTAFAMRALGLVRGDASLVEAAATTFERFGFQTQAAITRA